MKTAIVGFGFVGKALNSGIINSEILKIDPKLNTKISDLKSYNPDIVFICVPTPMGSNGSQDVTILKEVFKEIKRLEINSKIVERNKARDEKNYELADKIRKDLLDKGILIEDKDGKTSWKLK